MIDEDFLTLKAWVTKQLADFDTTGHALLNFMSSLEMEASMDAAMAVTLRRMVAAAFDDADRQREAS
jgi:hypothetical protein